MEVLITGGAGFIGSHIAEHHLKKGDKVIVVDNCCSKSYDNLKNFANNPNLVFIKSNFLNWDGLMQAAMRVSRIYNMAAIVGVQNVLEHPLSTLDGNVNILVRILKTVSKLDKKPVILVASTSEVYGAQEGMLNESMALHLETTMKIHASYVVSKIHNEAISKIYSSELSVPCVVTRIFNTVGPRQTGYYGMVVPRFVEQAVSNMPITVYGDGKQSRSFCNVVDTVKILDALLCEESATGDVFNVGNNEHISIMDLALLVKRVAASTSEIVHIPIDKAYHHDYMEIKHRQPNLEKTNSLINYRPQWTLEETIKDLIRYKKV